MSRVGSRRRWDERIALVGRDVHPRWDRAGDVRIALLGRVGVVLLVLVVVDDGDGRAPHAA